MDIPCIEDQSSDDEIFIGEITMEEIKKRLGLIPARKTVSYCSNIDSKNDADDSLKLIKAHSAPDISTVSDWEIKAVDRNYPQVPLMNNVCPKKPLLGFSLTPKPLKYTSRLNLGNKENLKQDVIGVKNKKRDVKLPAGPYRTPKETKVIDIPDVAVGKMPKPIAVIQPVKRNKF